MSNWAKRSFDTAGLYELVSVQESNKSAANSPVKPSAPSGPVPVLQDESAAVVAKQPYPLNGYTNCYRASHS
ncbi:MAG: hypothetical protein JXA30_13415 [Deltaproteobacteria bacterium]|nr:hypothetical protein [Deltaproteobacteria bacterium]